MAERLIAGVSIVDVTPPEGVELAGYPHCPRNNTGAHDRLFASCMYIDDGATRIAVIAMDLLMYSKKYVSSVRRRASERTGIPAKNIAIYCSHTHSAPWTSGRLDLEALEKGLKPDAGYIADLEKKLVDLIEEASINTFQAKIGVNKGYCGKEQGVGGNRRIPGGPADPEVFVVGLQDMSGNWKGCLTKYAVHPTVIHSESTVVTADYPAYIREYLGKSKPGMKLLFAQGTSGDQSTRYFRNGQNFEEACRIGSAIGSEVDKVLNEMTLSSDIKLSVRSIETDLELRILPESSFAEENVRKAENALESLRAANAPYIDIRNAELKLLGAEDILGYVRLSEKNIKPELLVDEIPAEIQVIGIGDCRIVGVQGEMFVELGLKIKNLSPFKNTFVIELANGVLPGYAYTREALEAGGYETDTSMLTPGSGETLVEKALELLKQS